MLFNSLLFLYGFLPITCIVFWCLRNGNHRLIWLTVMSYVFYAFWSYKFCAFLAISTIISYFAALALTRITDPTKRKLCLFLPIAVDLAALAYFKYFNFVLNNAKSVAEWFNVPLALPQLAILMPVGISFYTFHTISYIVDTYRGVITPTRNFWTFSCYVSLFSQLIAGPIVRYKHVAADLNGIGNADRKRYWNLGWSFFAIGMIEKVLIADSIASLINPPLTYYNQLSTVGAWLCMIGYSYQLFFDFAGYSNMAVGLGYMFSIHIPQNFNSPYKAVDLADFWHRWHMSLSTWLRDYLYIPLGGNKGPKWFVARNIMITMLLGGIWHGANWTFLAWGVYHGLLLLANRQWSSAWRRMPNFMQCTLTFFLVMLGWVVFRSRDFKMAGVWLTKLFTWQTDHVLPNTVTLCCLLLIAGFLAHRAPNTFEIDHRWNSFAVIGFGLLIILCIMVIVIGHEQPFLYFEF